MCDVNDFFVREQDHLTRPHHSKDKITALVEGFKSMHPTALQMLENLSAINVMMKIDDEEDANNFSERIQLDKHGVVLHQRIALICLEMRGLI